MSLYVRLGVPIVAGTVVAGTVAVATVAVGNALSQPAVGSVEEHPSGVSQASATSRADSDPEAVETSQRASNSAKLKRTSHVKTKKKVFFITVDDGTVKSKEALRYVRKRQLPVTVFLTNSAVAGQWGYFRKFASYGSVQNHTMTHASLTGAATPLRDEICKPQKIYEKRSGLAPTLLRPPYGNGGFSGDSTAAKQRIDNVARACGIQRIAMWNVVVGNGRVEYVRPPLRKGDIVLLHFGPNLAKELKKVRRMGKAQGLAPAPLTNFLP